MPAVLAVLRKVAVGLLRKGGSFLGKKAGSFFSFGVRSLNSAFQNRRQEEEKRKLQLLDLGALGLAAAKKPSFFDRLRADQPLFITLLVVGFLLVFVLFLPLLIIMPVALGLVVLSP